MNSNKHKVAPRAGVFFILIAIIFVGTLLSVRSIHAGDITDMAGRRVTINRSNRIWSAYPPITYLMYALDPSLLIGWTGPVSPQSKKYIRSPYRDMPVIGGWFGQRTPNLESLVAARPDIALVWDQSLMAGPNMAERLAEIRIPVVAVRLFRLSDYPAALTFLGDILDRKERARELARYIERTMEEMRSFASGIPKEKKVSVYYAIGPDGLTSDCDHSAFLEEAIELAGGRTVYRCKPEDRLMGRKIDQERLILLDPDVIITQDDVFFSRAYSDPTLKFLRAVSEKKVYMIPKVPFNWLNRPPSFMRALGIRWLASALFPQRYKANLERETKTFFKLFLGVDISDGEAREILRQPASS